ncbi:HD domain-containing protein [Nonomuraea candida]|uniref:HD domain-containing protein n=1 Tax=Nonomuraea candida TaxID=359159 RepID=UPI0005B7DCCE|nr:HD domain-containing protein [Nonomuraea candida]
MDYDDYDDLPFPRTDLALAAMRHAREIEHPAIFNHSMRSYLYGRFIGEEDGQRPDLDYDDELLFLGCVLHDTGLGEAGPGGPGNSEQPFDIDGADHAVRFLTDLGVSQERAEIVWDAVALHLHPDIALRKRPEIALVSAGAGFDLGPHGPYTLPEGYADRIHAALPRLRAASALYDAIVAQALAKPHKAPPFTLPGELVRQHTGEEWPTWRQLMSQPPSWNDYAPLTA